MRRWIVLGVLVTIGALSLVVTANQQQGDMVVEVEQLEDNLFVLRGAGGNTAVFVTRDGVAVVDTMMAGWGRPILDAIKQLTTKPVTMIINTHTHFDHVSGNVEFPAVIVPLATLETPGRARRFVAQGTSPPTAANPNQAVRVNGMVLRTETGDNNPNRFKAVCLVCPHEQCEVDFVSDPDELDPLVVAEIGQVEDPIYLCPCHNSAFTMTEGERLGGPAPRGLCRFRVTAVTVVAMEIGEVEEDVLLFF